MKIRGWLLKSVRKLSLVDLKADIKYASERLEATTDPVVQERLQRYLAELQELLKNHPKFQQAKEQQRAKRQLQKANAARDYQHDREAVDGGEARQAELDVDRVLRRAGLK